MNMWKMTVPWLVSAALPVVYLISSAPTYGEVSVRECIRLRGRLGGLVRLPALATSDLLTLEFDLQSASDAVFNVTVIFQDSATPAQTRARYNVLIDGGNSYRLDSVNEYFFRTPANTEGTINFRVHFASIPAGSHVATLRVNNTSGSPIDVTGVYMTPLFVDSDEKASVYDASGSLTVGSGWSVLGQLTSPNLPSRHLHLSSYVKAINARSVHLAYRVNGVVVDSIHKDFKNMDNGFVYHYTVSNASPNSNVKLEAQGPATVQTTEITAQTLQPYTVIEGFQATGVTIPNDGDLHAVFSSPLTPLNSLTLSGPQCCVQDHHQVCWWGHGWLEASISDSIEGSIRFWLFDNPGNTHDIQFESGWIGHSPDPQLSAYANPTSLVCGIGLFPPVTSTGEAYQYRMEVQTGTNRLCPGGPSITAHKGRVQVIVIPAPVKVQFPEPGYDAHTCTDSWAPECAHHCNFNPLLPTIIPAPPRNACNP